MASGEPREISVGAGGKSEVGSSEDIGKFLCPHGARGEEFRAGQPPFSAPSRPEFSVRAFHSMAKRTTRFPRRRNLWRRIPN